MKRAKRRGLVRNAAVMLGNVGDERDLALLRSASDDPDPAVREHAEWAVRRIENRARGFGYRAPRRDADLDSGVSSGTFTSNSTRYSMVYSFA